MADFISKSGKQYRLTFEDNFEGDMLDNTKWERCPEQRRQNIGGCWKDEMSEIHDGNLWLWAKIDKNGRPISGAIRSIKKFTQAYGYFEARLMFPRTTGFWGAFWMMCGDVSKVDGSAVSGAEIDIIETGECPRDRVNHAIHWDGYGADHKGVSKITGDKSLYHGWHTYALEWTKEEYIFYIDGEETWRESEMGICEYPGYLKLTTEFGTWAAPIVADELPDCMRVDYVRVYEEI